jgi:hypothetical protein
VRAGEHVIVGKNLPSKDVAAQLKTDDVEYL